mmetsp:Transcript_28233/g.43250  ORF Transcript_28233/g.43250 Transcript_28233/m.43250 type:complete len:348 (-) Transcript_28233:194-1237(-)|eukprot:CAMPEP_0194075820 /NCGR_PEP_ID=MMETSP0149-20130528/2745_1 /TAXON_ID=122233 /ORGANISM="Chaetoceros debilis, Strain MM31A-1" /LENGTH=347 /DNA_ID=CAMNT_0038756405 /DNA_START=65 /DNA_END=1108 /DNA_ORIENTATION=+
MKFTILSALLTAASALKSNSPSAKSMVSNSRRAEDGGDYDYSWIVDYSLVFDSCYVVDSYNFEDGDDNGIVSTSLVKYKMCETNNCMTGCTGAEYLVPMDQFVNSFTEWQMNDQEYQCEQKRESCGCDNDQVDDEDACEAQCYQAAGMYDMCVEAEDGDDDAYVFDLQDWMECTEIDYESDDGTQYYVGPKCSSNGEKINLGVFRDEYCTEAHDDGVFNDVYGMSLPYSSTNIVAENCISCTEADANNNGYYQDKELTEICDESYATSAKCETNLASNLAYPIEAGCEYIQRIEISSRGYIAPSSAFATTMAVIFGLATSGLAFVAYKMHMATKVRKINLNDDSAVV